MSFSLSQLIMPYKETCSDHFVLHLFICQLYCLLYLSIIHLVVKLYYESFPFLCYIHFNSIVVVERHLVLCLSDCPSILNCRSV